MENTFNSRRIIGKFIGRYIAWGIIIGFIAFILEDIAPQLINIGFTSSLIIYQTVIFIISTILVIYLSLKYALKDVVMTTKDEAMQVVKPIKVLLIIVAILVMITNLLYGYGIQQSGYKDAENKYKVVEGIKNPRNEELLKLEKEKVHSSSTLYLAGKEIVVIFTYVYAISYVENMIVGLVKNKKEEWLYKKVITQSAVRLCGNPKKTSET